jgi:hypothetical protein
VRHRYRVHPGIKRRQQLEIFWVCQVKSTRSRSSSGKQLPAGAVLRDGDGVDGASTRRPPTPRSRAQLHREAPRYQGRSASAVPRRCAWPPSSAKSTCYTPCRKDLGSSAALFLTAPRHKPLSTAPGAEQNTPRDRILINKTSSLQGRDRCDEAGFIPRSTSRSAYSVAPRS